MSDHQTHRTKLQALIEAAPLDELRVLLLVAQRLEANRPAPGRIDLGLPSDLQGDLVATLQGTIDATLIAAQGLARARERRP